MPSKLEWFFSIPQTQRVLHALGNVVVFIMGIR